VQRLSRDSFRDGRLFFSGIGAACIWLNVSSLPSKCNVDMGNREAVTHSSQHRFYKEQENLFITVFEKKSRSNC
jgi:hypothetical protein